MVISSAGREKVLSGLLVEKSAIEASRVRKSYFGDSAFSR